MNLRERERERERGRRADDSKRLLQDDFRFRIG
jgi:hypothetical protein